MCAKQFNKSNTALSQLKIVKFQPLAGKGYGDNVFSKGEKHLDGRLFRNNVKMKASATGRLHSAGGDFYLSRNW